MPAGLIVLDIDTDIINVKEGVSLILSQIDNYK